MKRRPPVQRSTAATIAAHLLSPEIEDAGSREHYLDAQLYDDWYRRRRDDVAWYRRLAHSVTGPILELGAGTGRVAWALARDGHAVTALERSQAMLTQLLARGPRSTVKAVHGDIRQFQLPHRFGLIIAPFNVLEHLYTPAEWTACMNCVRAHLGPRGVFAFDVQMPELAWLAHGKDSGVLPFRRRGDTTPWSYRSRHSYDAVNQIAEMHFTFRRGRERPRTMELTQRRYFPAELWQLVAGAGFTVRDRYGDYRNGPLTAKSRVQIVVATRA